MLSNTLTVKIKGSKGAAHLHTFINTRIFHSGFACDCGKNSPATTSF